MSLDKRKRKRLEVVSDSMESERRDDPQGEERTTGAKRRQYLNIRLKTEC